MATARDRRGLSAVVKSYLKEIFHIGEYIITIPNEDNVTYSYFLHDLSTDAPTDAGFKVIPEFDSKRPFHFLKPLSLLDFH